MSDGEDMGGVPPCDQCDSEFGALWCDKCSVVLCEECGGPEGKHAGHPLGTIGTSDDPYAYDEDDDDGAHAAAAADDDCMDAEDAALAAELGLGGAPPKRTKPSGVIQEEITEDEAYHVVEMMECNAHISCRKLFTERATAPMKAMLRARELPATMSSAVYGESEPVRLSDEQWAAFASNSYVVIDNFVTPAVAMEARAQTLGLVEQGLLTEFKNPLDVNRDHTARSDLRTFLQPGDQTGPAASGPLRHLVDRLEQLRAALGDGVKLTGEQHEYQLAFYGAEGQHYKRHRDAFPNDGSRRMTGQVGRRVTCTLYMNDYDEAHGGKLRLYCPDAGFDGETQLDVAPVAGRAVLFLSGAMDHEVLPSFAPRCAIAAWYS
mmetsp:Transcript_5877/g.18532  ORF Transcript_5877/g.18532 Transcript_5877/m.18532 type:complete len:377 (-) Transcript_5877:53-1183(-)